VSLVVLTATRHECRCCESRLDIWAPYHDYQHVSYCSYCNLIIVAVHLRIEFHERPCSLVQQQFTPKCAWYRLVHFSYMSIAILQIASKSLLSSFMISFFWRRSRHASSASASRVTLLWHVNHDPRSSLTNSSVELLSSTIQIFALNVGLFLVSVMYPNAAGLTVADDAFCGNGGLTNVDDVKKTGCIIAGSY
jgi:hypothetical protein